MGSVYPPPARLCVVDKGEAGCFGADGKLGSLVASLLRDAKGNVWAGLDSGLVRWTPGTPQFFSLPRSLSGYQISEENGVTLVSLPEGVARLVDAKMETAYPSPRAMRQFTTSALLRDRDGGLWMGTAGGGLAHFHQGRTDVYTQAEGLSGDAVDALFEDREGSIWVATPNGLDRFRDVVVPSFTLKQGLSNEWVTSVLAGEGGTVWIGTRGGLNQWDHGQVTIYRAHHQLTRPDVHEILDRGFPERVHALFRDSHGRIWISDRHGAGYLEHDRFVSVLNVPDTNVRSIVEDTQGDIWVVTSDSLVQVRDDRVLVRAVRAWQLLLAHGAAHPGPHPARDPTRRG